MCTVLAWSLLPACIHSSKDCDTRGRQARATPGEPRAWYRRAGSRRFHAVASIAVSSSSSTSAAGSRHQTLYIVAVFYQDLRAFGQAWGPGEPWSWSGRAYPWAVFTLSCCLLWWLPEDVSSYWSDEAAVMFTASCRKSVSACSTLARGCLLGAVVNPR